MPEDLSAVIEGIGVIVDCVGVLIILGGVIYTVLSFLTKLFSAHDSKPLLVYFRHNLGRSVLLGLEVLIAGDIIRSVAGVPTIEELMTLGLIVLIRAFLGLTFEVEVEGRWPWARTKTSQNS